MVEVLNWITAISDFLWGPWTMIFIGSVSVYFSIKARFFQARRFPYILRNTIGRIFSHEPKTAGNQTITPFQATTTSLAGTVGMGNMAGVATALSIGGPGAIFWMWVLAFFGMITKAAEITLAVHYREVKTDGRMQGGPMYYIRKGLGWNFLAVMFSLGILINSMFSSSMLQAHTVGRALKASYDFNPYLITGLMSLVTAMVVIGGIRRIGRFCQALVPSMTLLYVFGGLMIIGVNVGNLPNVLGSILQYAFSPAPALGGFVGAGVAAAIQMGMARGMLSNEAGLGTAPMVHANANVAHPFQQGLWGAFAVFIDTTVVCSISALVILSTGVLAGGTTGIELLLNAFATVFSANFSNLFISLAIATFCLTTQIGFYVYYETAINDLLGARAIKYLRWLYFLPGPVFAGVANVDQLWAFANISVAVSALPNLFAMLLLSGAFFVLMRDYLEGKMQYATAEIDKTRQYVQVPQ